MTPQPLHLPHWPQEGMHGLRGELRRWWLGVPALLRSRHWPFTFCALVIVALLLGFHQVVSSSVKQGEIMRMSAATRDQAITQCRALHLQRMRNRCLEQVDAPTATQAEASPPPNTASLRVAQR